MDAYQLSASVIQSIASLGWPIAIFGTFCLFRKEVATLLPFLKVKYKDVELSVRLDQAAEEAKALPQVPETPETEPTPEERDKFEQIAEINPRLAMMEVRVDIEDQLKSLANTAGVPVSKYQSLSSIIRFLRSRGILDSQASALADDLRAVGNNAAHSTDVILTKEDALQYRALADQFIRRCESLEASISPRDSDIARRSDA